MPETITEISAHSYYLPYQLLASFLLASAGMIVGLLLAWMLWGNRKSQVEMMKIRKEKLAAELKALQP